MLRSRSIHVAAALALGAAFCSAAHAQYYPPYPYYQPAPTPPSWNYDPYTRGLTGCPQRFPGSTTPCYPTYGQPSYLPYNTIGPNR